MHHCCLQASQIPASQTSPRAISECLCVVQSIREDGQVEPQVRIIRLRATRVSVSLKLQEFSPCLPEYPVVSVPRVHGKKVPLGGALTSLKGGERAIVLIPKYRAHGPHAMLDFIPIFLSLYACDSWTRTWTAQLRFGRLETS